MPVAYGGLRSWGGGSGMDNPSDGSLSSLVTESTLQSDAEWWRWQVSMNPEDIQVHHGLPVNTGCFCWLSLRHPSPLPHLVEVGVGGERDGVISEQHQERAGTLGGSGTPGWLLHSPAFRD